MIFCGMPAVDNSLYKTASLINCGRLPTICKIVFNDVRRYFHNDNHSLNKFLQQKTLCYSQRVYSIYLTSLLHLHITRIHSFSFPFQVLTFEKIRIELTKSPAEVKAHYLRITTTEYILDKVRRL